MMFILDSSEEIKRELTVYESKQVEVTNGDNIGCLALVSPDGVDYTIVVNNGKVFTWNKLVNCLKTL